MINKVFNMHCFTKKYVQCCICQELKRNNTKCAKCKNAYVCSDCMLSLCEHGHCSKCPICRQEKWRKNKIRKTLIIPSTIKVNININSSNINRENNETNDNEGGNKLGMYCYVSIMIIRNVCAYLLFSWLCGIMTVLFLHPFDTNASLALVIFLPLILGIFELTFCIYCCCVKICEVKIESSNDCCRIFRLY